MRASRGFGVLVVILALTAPAASAQVDRPLLGAAGEFPGQLFVGAGANDGESHEAYRLSGGALQRLTTSPPGRGITGIAASPDGVVVASARSGPVRVQRLDLGRANALDGGRSFGRGDFPTLSPSGIVAFPGVVGGRRGVVRVRGAGRRELLTARGVEEVAFAGEDLTALVGADERHAVVFGLGSPRPLRRTLEDPLRRDDFLGIVADGRRVLVRRSFGWTRVGWTGAIKNVRAKWVVLCAGPPGTVFASRAEPDGFGIRPIAQLDATTAKVIAEAGSISGGYFSGCGWRP